MHLDSKKIDTMIPYSVAIPTPFQIEKNPELAFSDHAPILVKDMFTGISWNILSPASPVISGLNYGVTEPTPDLISTHDKDSDDIKARMSRIVKALQQLQQKNKVQYIMLQEYGPKFLKIEDILAALGKNWRATLPQDGIVTLYNSDELTLKKDSEKYNKQHRYWQGIFTSKTGEQCALVNVHLEHQDLPDITAQLLHDIAKEHKDIPGVILGDFNNRFPQPQEELIWLPTGSVPPTFRKYQQLGHPYTVPGADWTDAAFKVSKKGEIEQLATPVLDPATGLIVSQAEIKKTLAVFFSKKGLSEIDKEETEFDNKTLSFQAKELTLPRPCVAFGPRWQKWLVGDQSLAEVRDSLTKKDRDIYSLHWAVNAYNEPAILLRVALQFYKDYLASKLTAVPHIAMAKPETLHDAASHYIFVKPNKFLQLYSVLEAALQAKKAKAKELSTPISSVSLSGQSSLFAKVQHPEGELKTIFPHSVSAKLVQTMEYLQTIIENGHQTELLRASKSFIRELIQKSYSPIAVIFAKLALSNYCLRFNEYTATQIIAFKQSLQQPGVTFRMPSYLFRPSHMQLAFINYLEILQLVAETDTSDFAPEDICQLTAELKVLWHNIKFCFGEVFKSLEQQICFFQSVCQADSVTAKLSDTDKAKYAADAAELKKFLQEYFTVIDSCQQTLWGSSVISMTLKKVAIETEEEVSDSKQTGVIDPILADALKGAQILAELSKSAQADAKPVLGISLSEEAFLKTEKVSAQDPKRPASEESRCLVM